MKLTIDQINKAVDSDNEACQEMQREYQDDIIFSRISQWDDWLEQYSTLEYRGQFDVLRGEVRRLMAEMLSNPVQVNYRPMNGASDDSAEILQGMYRTDMRDNRSMNAVKIAIRNQLEGGYGAWRLITEYEDDDVDGNNMVINRVAIHDTASCCIWDANAKAMDKSDAERCTIITGYSRDGWERVSKENGWPVQIASLQPKENPYQFNWVTNDKIYIGEHYVKSIKKEKVFFFSNEMGETVSYRQSEMKDVIDELEMAGYEKVSEKKIKTTEIHKYIISATEILEGPIRVAGKNIPVVPVYGEWSIIQGKEVYEGVVRLAKDGQRLRNAILSYNADIMMRSPRKKPFFFQEQIQGYEHMYDSSAEYPYYLVNRVDLNGGDLPLGAVGYLENPEISQQSAFLLDQATAAVKEVTTEGINPQGAVSSRMAEGSIYELNKRADMETYIFQDNLATAMRRDGEIYMSMAAEIYDNEREVTTTGIDGSESKVMLNAQDINYQKGVVETVNTINGKFEVWTDVGPAYQTQKEANRAQLVELLGKLPPQSAEYNIAMLCYISLLEGAGTETMREYANKQLVMQGLKKPETEEEMMMVEQQRIAAQQPNPMQQMVEAQTQASIRKDAAMALKHEVDAQRSMAETDKIQAQTLEHLSNISPNVQAREIGNLMSMLQIAQQQQEMNNNKQMQQLSNNSMMQR